MVILGTQLWLWAQKPHPPALQTIEIGLKGSWKVKTGLFQTVDELTSCTKAKYKINKDYIWNANHAKLL